MPPGSTSQAPWVEGESPFSRTFFAPGRKPLRESVSGGLLRFATGAAFLDTQGVMRLPLLSLCLLSCATLGPGDDDLCLAARVQPLSEGCIFRCNDWHHWGASILQEEDGQWHMFYARWPRTEGTQQGFHDWLWTSEIAHAVAPSVTGPWEMRGTVLASTWSGPFGARQAHNPCIRHIGERYYLYFVSQGSQVLPPIAERDNRSKNWMPARNTQCTGVAVAESIDGPFVRHESPIAVPSGPLVNVAVNPTLIARPDGRYQLIVKGDNKEGGLRIYGQALSSSPLGPFEWCEQTIATGFNTEDPDAWYDPARRRYYAIVTRAGSRRATRSR